MRVKAPPVVEPQAFSPADMVDSQTAMIGLIAGLVILNPPKISLRLVGSLGACAALVKVAASFGYEADLVVVAAALVADATWTRAVAGAFSRWLFDSVSRLRASQLTQVALHLRQAQLFRYWLFVAAQRSLAI